MMRELLRKTLNFRTAVNEMNVEIKNLKVSVNGKQVAKNISLVMSSGEVHALMGPNGSGKSSLAQVITGNPGYKIESGDIFIDGKSVLSLSPAERSKLGVFLMFQNPVDIAGVSLSKLLFQMAKQKDEKLSFVQFKKQLNENLELLGLPFDFCERDVNVGLSGGERKRAEMLQLLTIKPSFVVLDEMDSGLDVDSMQLLSKVFNTLKGPNFSALVITHYSRLLQYIVPDKVHILSNGEIVLSGEKSLANDIEKKGYEALVK
jgi:Fe-S cluster assembly ATP-binding protein